MCSYKALSALETKLPSPRPAPPPSGCRLHAGGNPHEIKPPLAHSSSNFDSEELTSSLRILGSLSAREGVAQRLSQGGRGFREITPVSQRPWKLCSVHARCERAALTAAGPNVSRKPASRVRGCPVSGPMLSTAGHPRCGPLFHSLNHTATRCADTADRTNRTAVPAARRPRRAQRKPSHLPSFSLWSLLLTTSSKTHHFRRVKNTL